MTIAPHILELPLRRRDGSIHAYAIIDAGEDADRLAALRWHLSSWGYARRSIALPNNRFKSVALHRDVMGLTSDDPRRVDHINGDPLDNRRANLRFATSAENAQNRRGSNRGARSRYRGVTWSKKSQKWAAGAMLEGKQHWLGVFDDEFAAALRAVEFRAEHMPFSADAEWLKEYRDTLRARERMGFVTPRSRQQADKMVAQIEACDRHLARFRETLAA